MKGFTLIELLAVIILISMIFLLVYFNIDDSKTLSREKSYEMQVNSIIKAAKNWEIEHIGLLPDDSSEVYHLSLEDLKKSGNIKKDEIINPIDDSIMNGCINISCSNSNCKQYTYEYVETSCDLQDEYHNKIKTILTSAQNWVNDNPQISSNVLNDSYDLSVQILKDSGYLSNEDIINPIDNSVMNGCIKITCSNSECSVYNYKYLEKVC